MSAIFRHGMRHELLPRVEATNPMRYVRQRGKRQRIPLALAVEQFQSLFGALRQRERTMVLLDCGSGLRCGELIGLQWRDFDFACKQMSVTRSVVDMVSGKVKTEASQKTVPLDDFMIEEVLAWYRITPYQKPEDWVFASDSPRAGAKRGKQPYWPMTIMRMFIKPVAKRLGIGNVSWHTFRHTYSNLLHANREDPKVVQELIPDILSLGTVVRVLQNLLKEQVSIRDLLTIFETLADEGHKNKDIEVLTESVRKGLSRAITHKYMNERKEIPVMTLAPRVEELVANSLLQTEQGVQLIMDPRQAQGLLTQISKTIEMHPEIAGQPILLTSPTARRHLFKLTNRFLPQVVVLSHNEISSDAQISAVGLVEMGHAG